MAADNETLSDGAVEVIPKQPRSTPWLAIGLAIVLMPLASYALTEFVLIPKIRDALSEPGATPVRDVQSTSSTRAAQPHPYIHEFKGIIVNVAGTMGTRYLKISFQTAGSNSSLDTKLTQHRAAILDQILAILATRTLPELEETGARNALRSALVEAINDTVGQPLVEDLYFTEFVVQ